MSMKRWGTDVQLQVRLDPGALLRSGLNLVFPSLSDLLFQVGFPLKQASPPVPQRGPGQLQASILLNSLESQNEGLFTGIGHKSLSESVTVTSRMKCSN